jgi:hypothetical protein
MRSYLIVFDQPAEEKRVIPEIERFALRTLGAISRFSAATPFVVLAWFVARALLDVDIVRLRLVRATLLLAALLLGFTFLDKRSQVVGNIEAIGHGEGSGFRVSDGAGLVVRLWGSRWVFPPRVGVVAGDPSEGVEGW